MRDLICQTWLYSNISFSRPSPKVQSFLLWAKSQLHGTPPTRKLAPLQSLAYPHQSPCHLHNSLPKISTLPSSLLQLLITKRTKKWSPVDGATRTVTTVWACSKYAPFLTYLSVNLAFPFLFLIYILEWTRYRFPSYCQSFSQ